MNGMINQEMSQQGTPPQSAPPQEQGAPNNMKGDQKALAGIFKILSSQMANAMYDQEDAIVEAVRVGGPKSMATIIARFIVMSVNSLKLSGKKIDTGMMIVAIMDLTKSLAELLVAAKVIEKDSQLIEEAFFAAASIADDELQREALSSKDRESFAAIMKAMRQAQQKRRQGPQAGPEQEVLA